MLRKLTTAYEPEYLAAIFESAGPTFREQEFAEYKANRSEMPDDLARQIPYVRRLLDAMRIPVLAYEGFEADDVIGAIARRAEQAGADVAIVSSDKDMLQLVNEHVSMYNPIQEDLWYDEAKVEEKMGVKPAQVADLLALKGDAIDNIPGAPGIGDKGARDLIARFGSVEAALDRAAELGDKGYGKRYRESLTGNRERIELSKRLATIDTSVPIPFRMEDVAAQAPDTGALKGIFKELEFFSLMEALGPEEDTRPRDYATLDTESAVDAFLAAIPADVPVAVSVASYEPEGGSMFDAEPQPVIGLAWQPGAGARRPVLAGRAAAAAARRRRAPEDRARHQAGAAHARLLVHRAARLRARCDALRLPAQRRPFRLLARQAGARPPGPQARSSCRAPGRLRARASRDAQPRSGRARPAQRLRNHRSAPGPRAGAYGAPRRARRSRRDAPALGHDGHGDPAPHQRDLTPSPAAPSTSTRRSNWAKCCSRTWGCPRR